VLEDARDTALKELEEDKARLGANAVLGIDLDDETIRAGGSMLMLSASGTAVVVGLEVLPSAHGGPCVAETFSKLGKHRVH
jgi:uncharacterized protein YbjQ (UPF0145 family)